MVVQINNDLNTFPFHRKCDAIFPMNIEIDTYTETVASFLMWWNPFGNICVHVRGADRKKRLLLKM